MKTNTSPEARQTGPFASVSTKSLFYIGCVYVLIAAAAFCLALKPDKHIGFNDFGSFWESGRAASHGLDPYAKYPLTWEFADSAADLNLNPPTVLPLFQAFGAVNAPLSMWLWTFLNAVAFLVAVAALLWRKQWAVPRSHVLWVFLAPTVLDSLVLGQIYLALFAISAAAWLCLERNRPIVAGVLIGLIVVTKPNFGLWPLGLLLAGHRRPAFAAGATAFAMIALSLCLYGSSSYSEWLVAIASHHYAHLNVTEVSLRGFFERLALPTLAHTIPVMLGVGVSAWIWRIRGKAGVADISLLAMSTAILASPLAWCHYTLLIVPGMLGRRLNGPTTAGALLLAIPMFVPLIVLHGLSGTTMQTALADNIYFLGTCLVFLGIGLETLAPPYRRCIGEPAGSAIPSR
ncbi:glycosyltransferase family 87 protein [Paraburkholderia phosphatilytica]|uniref:glycosyltransferase family 87 protein n=1 Tax=Paraburkholderia phosphatilytica TaxID=2282883 RepID=UPI0013DF40FF|nr:glycosyltransferase family 87 protein [Paraburkholderia phosphatilytica]